MKDGKTYQFKPLKTLAGWARGLMVAFLIVLTLFTALLAFGLFTGTPVDFNAEDLDGIGLLTSLSALLSLTVQVVSGIVSLLWIYGAARNTRAVRPQLDLKPIWAVAWFFVPIAFWFKPYQYMCQIWSTAKGPQDGRYLKEARPVVMWWTFWVIAMISGNIAWRIDDPGAYSIAQLINSLFVFLATIQFMGLVGSITRMQADTDIRIVEQF